MKPGQNSACPTGGFLVWTSLKGVEYTGESIDASNEDMEVLDGKNAVADQIIWAAQVVLWVLVGHHHPSGARDMLVPSGFPSGSLVLPSMVPKILNCNHQQEFFLLLGEDGDEPSVHGSCI